MARPFSLTTQAHGLDRYGLWLTMLAFMSALAIVWAVWFAANRPLYFESSEQVQVQPRSEEVMVSEQRGSIVMNNRHRLRWIEAWFPPDNDRRFARDSKARVTVPGAHGDVELPAVVEHVDYDERGVTVLLRVSSPVNGDPLLHRPPSRARVKLRPHSLLPAGALSVRDSE